jgi:ArpU family phage transcriptional regulator
MNTLQTYHKGVQAVKHVLKELPPLDAKLTREAVEAELEKYLFYKMIDPEEERREAKVTASYELRESQRTNQTSDSTSDIALHNVQQEEQRRAHIYKVDRAVSRLNKRQRQLITLRYLTEFGVNDTETYLDMEITAPTYTKIRNEAIYMLSLILRVYVVKQ